MDKESFETIGLVSDFLDSRFWLSNYPYFILQICVKISFRMKHFIIFLSLIFAVSAVAKKIQVSYIKHPTDGHPFGDAIHFRYDKTQKTAWISGNSYFKGFRWSKREISEDEGKKIEQAVSELGIDKPGKVYPSADGIFRVSIDDRTVEWKDFRSDDEKSRTGKVVRFLNNLLMDEKEPPVHFAPFEGEVVLKLDCDSISASGVIRVIALNRGIATGNLKPIGDRIKAYWGYKPLPSGDASVSHQILAGKKVDMTWSLDLQSSKQSSSRNQEQSSSRTQLLFLTEGLVETPLPEEMAPQYQEIHRCDLPEKLTSLPSKFDETSSPASLNTLTGIWSFREEHITGETFYLVIKDSKILFLGAENFGEHGVAYYSTEAKDVKYSATKQLRFELGQVTFYGKAFSPMRQTQDATENSVGSGAVNFRFEGISSENMLSMRCFSKSFSSCPAPIFNFKKN